MKMYFLLVSILVLHQAVAIEVETNKPMEAISEITPTTVNEKVMVVQCNATAFCPDGNTCCRLGSGQWGCCPLPNAVCCSDHEHCCPNGYTCTGSGSCVPGSQVMKQFRKNAALVKVKNVVCPGGTSECPDGNTCCKLASGQWGCCPLLNAVCCSDHLHCCPNGYTCEAGGFCTRGSQVMKQFRKNAAIIKAKNVVCHGGQEECPDGDTCCKVASGEYGCCPLPDAVCCSDHEHCCPHGYTCGTEGCEKGSQVMKQFRKNAAIIKVKSVVCPGGQSECPDGNTCCKLASGQWGCCPLPNAVCCSDHEHCCPNGYTCQEGGICTRGSQVIKQFKKNAAIKAKTVVCPGGGSECPDGNTCCKLAGGEYGCCPLPNAVCCSDHEHCCPEGNTCDLSAGTCIPHKSGPATQLFLRKPATRLPKAKNVVCPGGRSECPDGNTCCKLASGEYGCCPLPNAVCCSDHEHCCPEGNTCDLSAGTCIPHKSGPATQLFLRKPATRLAKEGKPVKNK